MNNENLHHFYYQNKLHDLDYNLDIFRLAHQTAPHVEMFLNEYDVVAGGGSTGVGVSRYITAVDSRMLIKILTAWGRGG